MAKDPAILFYTSDFYIGTTGMTDEQVGRYIRLLCLHHQNGRLSEFVMRNTMAGELDPGVIAKFKIDDDGNYYNERMELEADKRRNFTASRVKNLQGTKKEPAKKKTAHMDTHMKPHMDTHMVNENEDVIKDGIAVKNKVIPLKDVRHKYGEYSNVLLNDADYEKLKAEFHDYQSRIERLSEYMASKGISYKNHLATIRSWAKKDKMGGKPISAKDDANKDYGTGEEGWS